MYEYQQCKGLHWAADEEVSLKPPSMMQHHYVWFVMNPHT
eukprot:COSAG01_NODE_2499_length_7562_cov_15.842578_9_plen_40_part_00